MSNTRKTNIIRFLSDFANISLTIIMLLVLVALITLTTII